MALSALVSFAVLVDIGLIAVDLDTVLGVLAVVAVTVGADKRLVAVAGSLPLVKTLGAPVSVGVAGAILVVPIASSRVVSKGRGIARLSLPLVGATVPPASNETSLASKTKTKSLKSKKGEGRGGQQLGRPLVDTKTLGAPVSVRVAGTVLVVAISASRVVGKGRGIAGLSLPLVVPEAVPVVDITVLGLIGAGQTSSEKAKTDQTDLGRPLVETLGGPLSVGVARSVLVVSIAACGMVGKGRAVGGLSFSLVVAVASDGVAVAVVLGSVAVAVATVVASSGTGRETEDNKRFCCHDFAIGQFLAANQAQLNCNVRVNPH